MYSTKSDDEEVERASIALAVETGDAGGLDEDPSGRRSCRNVRPFHKGWLHKRTHGFFVKKWDKRYFVLDKHNHKLSWWRRKADADAEKKPACVITLHDKMNVVLDVPEKVIKRRSVFKIEDPLKKNTRKRMEFYLAVDSEFGKYSWVTQIWDVIDPHGAKSADLGLTISFNPLRASSKKLIDDGATKETDSNSPRNLWDPKCIRVKLPWVVYLPVRWSDVDACKETEVEIKRALRRAKVSGRSHRMVITSVLRLLCSDVRNCIVRRRAMEEINRFSDKELLRYMLQLVQAIRFDITKDHNTKHATPLAKILVERAAKSLEIANILRWLLQIEVEAKRPEGIVDVAELIEQFNDLGYELSLGAIDEGFFDGTLDDDNNNPAQVWRQQQERFHSTVRLMWDRFTSIDASDKEREIGDMLRAQGAFVNDLQRVWTQATKSEKREKIAAKKIRLRQILSKGVLHAGENADPDKAFNEALPSLQRGSGIFHPLNTEIPFRRLDPYECSIFRSAQAPMMITVTNGIILPPEMRKNAREDLDSATKISSTESDNTSELRGNVSVGSLPVAPTTDVDEATEKIEVACIGAADRIVTLTNKSDGPKGDAPTIPKNDSLRRKVSSKALLLLGQRGSTRSNDDVLCVASDSASGLESTSPHPKITKQTPERREVVVSVVGLTNLRALREAASFRKKMSSISHGNIAGAAILHRIYVSVECGLKRSLTKEVAVADTDDEVKFDASFEMTFNNIGPDQPPPSNIIVTIFGIAHRRRRVSTHDSTRRRAVTMEQLTTSPSCAEGIELMRAKISLEKRWDCPITTVDMVVESADDGDGDPREFRPAHGDEPCLAIEVEASIQRYVRRSTRRLLPSLQQLTAAENAQRFRFIFKSGDDMRQDVLIMQLIESMDLWLKNRGMDAKLCPYRILTTSMDTGMVEMVSNSTTLASILEENGSILQFFKDTGSSSSTDHLGVKTSVMNTYVHSCAAYSVITYILGLGDRHFDNLMLKPTGEFFHIDFGWAFGHDPKPYPSKMRLNVDIINGMGGVDADSWFGLFEKLCVDTFLILRQHVDEIVTLLSLMESANIHHMGVANEAMRAVEFVRGNCMPDLNDKEAEEALKGIIHQSISAVMPEVMEYFHRVAVSFK